MARKKRRVTLIHNETAGNANHGRSGIVEPIENTGCSVTSVSSEDGALDRLLDQPSELVVVAGGDGTINKIACKAKPDGPPLTILPLGTVNNIATALGFSGSLEALVGAWDTTKSRHFYRLGVEGPWGLACMLEGIGFGTIEQAIDEVERSKPSLRQAQKWIARSILTSSPEKLEVSLGSETLSGCFALLELTNIPLVGPRLHLARAADPSQNSIHLAFLEDGEKKRRQFSKWLSRASTDAPAPVTTYSARRVMIRGYFRRVRLNDKIWSPPPPADGRQEQPTSVYLEAESEPIHFLVPDVAPTRS
jgi:diacylglycerol kinase family enzyme